MLNKIIKKYSWVKKILIGGSLFLIASAFVLWYIFTATFSDTVNKKSDFTFNTIDLIHEFQKNDTIANKKYAEEIIIVNGRISELEYADTTINIKISDTTTDAYIIFAFQQQHLNETKQLIVGNLISIKGSCSGGAYSKILGTEFVTFKRCAINK